MHAVIEACLCGMGCSVDHLLGLQHGHCSMGMLPDMAILKKLRDVSLTNAAFQLAG